MANPTFDLTDFRVLVRLGFIVLAASLGSSSLPAQSPRLDARTAAPASAVGCTVAAGETERLLSGAVVDEQGGRVPGATVTIRCGTFAREVRTTSDGAFAVRLPPGTYSVRVGRSGFRPFTKQIVIESGKDSEMTFALTVDTVTQAITVSAGDAIVPVDSISATKTDTPLLEIPQSVTVVTADQIREQASFNLQETLRYTAGVRNELYGVDNRGDWISLRGSDESTMLVDGLRLPLTGWYGVVRTEPYACERIDVLRGPSSIIAGQNDPGGVVNMVSKRPRAATGREFGVRFGNYNRREFFGDLTGPLKADGTWLYRFVGLGRDTDTQVRHADEQRALAAPSLTWRPNSRHSVTLFGEYQYDRSRNTNAFLGLVGTLQPAPNGPIPTDLFIGEPAWDRYGGARRRYGYSTTSLFGESWQFRHNFRHDRVNGMMKSMYAAWWDGFLDENGKPDADGRYLGRQWYLYDDRSRVTTADVLLQGNVETGAVKHTLLFGVDGMVHDAGQRSAEASGTPLNVYSPVYGRFAEPQLGDARLTENAIRRLGVLVQDQIKIFDRVSLRAGLRRDIVRNAVIGGEVRKDWATTGNVGLVYHLLPGLAPYVSYSQSFNPIAGTDAAGRAFKPKRGEQVELGLKWQAQSLPLQATMALYSLKERNRLATDPDNFGYSVQIGDARIKGVELEARGQLKSWTGLASYTYTRARASAASWGGDLDPIQQIEGIPENTASLWAIHDFSHLRLAGFRLGGGVRHVGRIGDGTGRIFVPAVRLLDAMASFDRGPLRYSININNLADKAYIATCLARGDCWFGMRRTISVTVGFRY